MQDIAVCVVGLSHIRHISDIFGQRRTCLYFLRYMISATKNISKRFLDFEFDKCLASSPDA